MWNEKKSPLRIEKRFEFDNYQITSKFLKEIDNLSKKKNIFPNISFGANFASLTIFLDSKSITSEIENFANQADIYYKKIISE